MKTVHAVFENGVFRPKEPVNLPERAEVEFEPRQVIREPSKEGMRRIQSVLEQRFESGESDVAARHNEHQP
jgi:predicted DNA-binding antitoxin AbrB/MazE fold protein